jgi:hypothetical protein
MVCKWYDSPFCASKKQITLITTLQIVCFLFTSFWRWSTRTVAIYVLWCVWKQTTIKSALQNNYQTVQNILRHYLHDIVSSEKVPETMLWILNRKLNGKNFLRSILNGCPHICLRKVRKFIKDSGCLFSGPSLEMVSSEEYYFHCVTILYSLGVSYDNNMIYDAV